MHCSVDSQPLDAPIQAPAEIRNRDEAEGVTAHVALLYIQLNQEITAQNKKIVAARSHDKEIQSIRERIAKSEARLECWAISNRTALFGESQSLEMRQGWLKFKWSTAVKLLPGWTDKTVLVQLCKLARRAKSLAAYIRVKHELDRQQILKDSSTEVAKLSADQAAAFGVQVAREEKFRVEPKIEQAAA
jgi:hypothetical protein